MDRSEASYVKFLEMFLADQLSQARVTSSARPKISRMVRRLHQFPRPAEARVFTKWFLGSKADGADAGALVGRKRDAILPVIVPWSRLSLWQSGEVSLLIRNRLLRRLFLLIYAVQGSILGALRRFRWSWPE